MKYKAVSLGVVEEVTLGEDQSQIVVQVRMDERAESLLTEDTRFWVVRPRLSGGLQGVQRGLSTLVSGAYVAMDPGEGAGEPKRHAVFLPSSQTPSPLSFSATERGAQANDLALLLDRLR